MIIIRRKKINVEEAGRPLASVCLIKKKKEKEKSPLQPTVITPVLSIWMVSQERAF